MAMGHIRKKPNLLNNKLLAIREFLNIGQADMASKLESDILANSGKDYPIQPGRTSEYETGRREPNLLVLVAYARLGRVHLESVVDDGITVEALRSRLGRELNDPQQRKKHKRTNPQDGLRTTARLHTITRVSVNLDTQTVVTPQGTHLVCRYCKTPICAAVCRHCNTPLYAANGSICYLHANSGVAACEAPQVEGLPNRATPYNDNTTYVAYRAELITEMTERMFSYAGVRHSPGELLENLLADARYFADAKGLAFDEHERHSYRLYLENKSDGATG